MENIYHYCTYGTFKEIIKNSTLRLSNIRNCNDELEMVHQLKQYEHIPLISAHCTYEDNL